MVVICQEGCECCGCVATFFRVCGICPGTFSEYSFGAPFLLSRLVAVVTVSEVKRKVGLAMLGEARIGEFDAAHAILLKILGNIVAHPGEAKYRKLRTTKRTTNAKISQLLQTKGVRALLVGCGFTEEGDSLVLADDAPASPCAAALEGLASTAAAFAAKEQARKENDAQQRKEKECCENEKRNTMRAGISDDAAARKEPGWKAKAAGIKGGRDIVTPSDNGASGSGG